MDRSTSNYDKIVPKSILLYISECTRSFKSIFRNFYYYLESVYRGRKEKLFARIERKEKSPNTENVTVT